VKIRRRISDARKVTALARAVSMVLLAAMRGEDLACDLGGGVKVKGYYLEIDNKPVTRIDIHGLVELARGKMEESDENKAGNTGEPNRQV